MYCLLTVLILLISGDEVDSALTLVVTPTRPMEMLTPLNITCLYTPSSSSVPPATSIVLNKNLKHVVVLNSSQTEIKIEKDDVTFEGQLSSKNAYNASYVQVVWKTSRVDLSAGYDCFVQGGENEYTRQTVVVVKPSLDESVRYFVSQNLELKTALLGKTNDIDQLKLQLTTIAPKVDQLDGKIESNYREQVNKLNQCSDNVTDLKTSLLNKAKDVDDFKLQINPKVDEINSKIEVYYRELKSTNTQLSANLADINNSLMSKANEINELKNGNWRFESGSFNCGDEYKGFPSNDYYYTYHYDFFTVKFQTPFKAPPIVMYSITVLKTDIKTYYGYVTSYYDLNTQGFNFVCGEWRGSVIYNIGVFWVAIGR